MPPRAVHLPQIEETVKDRLDRNGDDDAAEAVEAFENKYKRLKDKYKVCLSGLPGLLRMPRGWGCDYLLSV